MGNHMGDATKMIPAREQAARVIAEMLSEAGEPCASAELIATQVTQALSDAGLLAGGWRPISEAPKDAFVLARGTLDPHPDSRGLYAGLDRIKPAVIYWDDVDDSWCPVGATWLGPWFKPTTWMPLPSPPEEGA